jgi:PCO_ADO
MGIFVFPPGAKIPLHDHPGMCVISRVLYGDIHRLSLDLLPDRDESSFSEDQPCSPATQSKRQRRGSSDNAHESHASDCRKISRDLGQSSVSDDSSSGSSTPTEDNGERAGLPPGSRRAMMHKNQDHLLAPGVTVLYPFQGNLHEFVAGPNGAAVLDVLLPPYSSEDHRDCTFYRIQTSPRAEGTQLDDTNSQRAATTILRGPDENFRAGSTDVDEVELHQDPDESKDLELCWIVPTSQPHDFHCISGVYKSIGAA